MSDPDDMRPIPASHVMLEGLRLVPSLLAECIVGILMLKGTLSGQEGMMAMLAILAGQLYPKALLSTPGTTRAGGTSSGGSTP